MPSGWRTQEVEESIAGARAGLWVLGLPTHLDKYHVLMADWYAPFEYQAWESALEGVGDREPAVRVHLTRDGEQLLFDFHPNPVHLLVYMQADSLPLLCPPQHSATEIDDLTPLQQVEEQLAALDLERQSCVERRTLGSSGRG